MLMTIAKLLHNKAAVASMSVGMLIAAGMFIYQTNHPPCCDADQYLNLSRLYASSDISARSNEASLRTYAYPLFLSYLRALVSVTNLPLILLVSLVQLGIHLLATAKYATGVRCDSTTVGSSVLVALLLNPFAYPYVSLTLTDSLYASLALLWLYAAIRTFSRDEGDFTETLGQAIAPALLSSLIIAVRPAGIWTAAVTAAGYLYIIGLRLKSNGDRLTLAALAITAFAVPLLPQIYINLANFNRLTPFPVFDLGSAQIQWGIEMLKYATNLSGGDPRLVYANPLYSAGQGLSWYWTHPIKAAATLLLKFTSAFDQDYLFPYIYDLRPWYRWFTGVISLSVFTLGILGLACHALVPSRFPIKIGPRYFPLSCLIAWGAVTLSSAIELRFSLPMYALLIPCAIGYALFTLRLDDKRLQAVAALVAAVVFACAIGMAWYVRLQNPHY